MIAYIRGTIEWIDEDCIIIDNNGMGYQVFITSTAIEKLPPKGNEVKIFTYHYVREDLVTLYGFLNMEELNLFKKLISVSGIGPKVAMAMLSVNTPEDLVYAIIAEDIKKLSKSPGVGKKTAQRIILDLKDKVSTDVLNNMNETISGDATKNDNITNDAVSALEALGYSRSQAMQVVCSIDNPNDDVEYLVKEALKKLMPR